MRKWETSPMRLWLSLLLLASLTLPAQSIKKEYVFIAVDEENPVGQSCLR